MDRTSSPKKGQRRLAFGHTSHPQLKRDADDEITVIRAGYGRRFGAKSPDLYGPGPEYSADENSPKRPSRSESVPGTSPTTGGRWTRLPLNKVPGNDALSKLGYELRYAENRLITWESNSEMQQKLKRLFSSSGYFMNEHGKVECFCCHMQTDWRGVVNPAGHHHMINPECRFIRHEEVGNVPFGCQVSSSVSSSDEDDAFLLKNPIQRVHEKRPRYSSLLETPPRTPVPTRGVANLETNVQMEALPEAPGPSGLQSRASRGDRRC